MDELSTVLRPLGNGPADVDSLTRRLRTELKARRLTTEHVTATASSATALVGRPDGQVCRHAAWRTPFTEELGPWEEWEVPASKAGAPTRLRPVDSGDYTVDHT